MIGVAFVIGAIATLAITGSSILDSDPTSYIIVTMLMGVVFIFFTLKDRRPATRSEYGTVGAVVAFMVYLVILSYARGSLSFEFLSYRIDALLLPLFLLSIVMAVAGFKGVKKYAPVMAYLLFASPILLMPLLTTNAGLSSISASVVYSVLKATGANVVQSGLYILAPSGQAIEIASTCVPVGTFVAFIMLMLPVSYLYDGKPSRKVAWLVAGVALLFVLNIIRMALVSLAWAYSGLGSAVATFHTLGGAIIFYIAIIAMLLAYRKFGLKLNFGRNWRKRLALAFGDFDIEENYSKIIAALVIALAVLFLSVGYLHSSDVSAALFTGTPITNSSYLQLYHMTISRINASGVRYSYLGSYNGSMMFELGGGSPANATYMVVSFYPFPEKGGNMLMYSNTISRSSYITKPGITVTSLSALASNATFFISYFAVPMIVNNSAVSANFEVFAAEEAQGIEYCNPASDSGLSEYLESGIYNLLQANSQLPVLCSAEKIALG